MNNTEDSTTCPVCPLHLSINLISHLTKKLSDWFASHDTVSFAPLALRLLIAYEFLEAGIEKAKGGNWFADLAFPFPFNILPADFNWYLAMGLEIIAPIALFLGFATRFFSAALIILTIVAIITVHAPEHWYLFNFFKGYVITDQGHGNYKLPVMYLFMLVSLVCSGSGRLSIDEWMRHRLGCCYGQ